jgi:hypothetical protein
MSHTATPWKFADCIIRKDGFLQNEARDNAWIGECDKRDDAKRIVECVNACAGMQNPAEEIQAMRTELSQLRTAKARLVEFVRKSQVFLNSHPSFSAGDQYKENKQLLTEMEGKP